MPKPRPQYEKFLSLIVDKLVSNEGYLYKDLELMGKKIDIPRSTVYESKEIAIKNNILRKENDFYYKVDTDTDKSITRNKKNQVITKNLRIKI